MPLKRSTLNVVIDLSAFVTFVLLTSTGILIRHVFPPGQGRFTTIWGWNRHEWGEFHFYVSLVFILCLIFHLIIHRRWITSVIRGRSRDGSGYRVVLGIIALLALLAGAAAPFFATVETTQQGTHRKLSEM